VSGAVCGAVDGGAYKGDGGAVKGDEFVEDVVFEEVGDA